jgi:hypothetical protein
MRFGVRDCDLARHEQPAHRVSRSLLIVDAVLLSDSCAPSLSASRLGSTKINCALLRSLRKRWTRAPC